MHQENASAPCGSRAGSRPGSWGDLRIRVLSAVALAVPGLAAVLAGGGWMVAFCAVIAAVLALEWRSLFNRKQVIAAEGGRPRPALRLPGRIASFLDRSDLRIETVWDLLFAALCAAMPVTAGWTGDLSAIWPIAVIATIVGVLPLGASRGPSRLVWGALGVLIAGIAPVAFVELRAFDLRFALWLLAIVICTDIGGYFAGRAIGGPKLSPWISPTKTWAGMAGGLALGIAGSIVYTSQVFRGDWFSLPQIVLLGLILSAVAQAGDFVESRLKRIAGVRDSSALIPGHGGALDRLDSLIAPLIGLTTLYLLDEVRRWWELRLVLEQ